MNLDKLRFQKFGGCILVCITSDKMASWECVYSRIMLNYIQELNTKYCNTRGKVAVKNLREILLKFFVKAKRLMCSRQINIQTFVHGLTCLNLHLDIVWIAINCSAVEHLDYFNLIFKNEEHSTDFGERLADFVCLVNDNLVFEQQVLIDIISFLESYEEHSLYVCLNKFIERTYELMKFQSAFTDSSTVLKNLSVFKAGVQKHVYLGLMNMLFTDSGVNIMHALECCEAYQPICCAQFDALCSAILTFINFTEIIDNVEAIIINCCRTNIDLNWNHISKFIYHSVRTVINVLSILKIGINNMIEKSLADSQKYFLYAALLLGRIISLNTVGAGITYLQWYSSTFSSESNRPLNSIPKAKFFFKSMIDILDVELPQYIKAHIHKAASVPASCQGDLSDYLQLAKARLISMNESVEIGLFENVTESHASENDVTCVVKQYESTGKISSKILAALTFRRQYFEKAFLPILLSSCPGPNSPHHAVIKKLYELGKMSNVMFNKHKDTCKCS